MTPAEKIRQARIEAKFSQADAGVLVGVSRWAIISWEMGRTEPHPAVLDALLRALKRATGKPRPRKPRQPRKTRQQAV